MRLKATYDASTTAFRVGGDRLRRRPQPPAVPGRAVVVRLPQRVVVVLGAQVLPPLGDHEEAACADGADVRVVVGVDADLVPLHVAQVAEAQGAVGALVGLLPRVGAQVHPQGRVVHKRLAAVRARVRLLLHVRPQVDLRGGVVRPRKSRAIVTRRWREELNRRLFFEGGLKTLEGTGESGSGEEDGN